MSLLGLPDWRWGVRVASTTRSCSIQKRTEKASNRKGEREGKREVENETREKREEEGR